jgi:hypothetical protein
MSITFWSWGFILYWSLGKYFPAAVSRPSLFKASGIAKSRSLFVAAVMRRL